MTGTKVLARARAAGLTLSIVDGRDIWVEPADRLTDELRELIVAGKRELLAALTPPPDDPAAHRIRGRLLRWGGPRLWPALPQAGIGRGGEAWSTWLWTADVDRLARALSEAFGSGGGEATETELLSWAAGTTLGADEADAPAAPVDGPSYPLPWNAAADPLAVTDDRCVLCGGPVAPPNRAVCASCCRPK